ncbi:MAG: L-fucose/L-arabinose isomerase family protein [Flavobacteriaceae bacterium]|nr:L-fucose/L-arabinose isomerase family protein [Flavobacteriaceae bacterium]
MQENTIKRISISKASNKFIKPITTTIGILGVGHKPYWNQFDGLFQEMLNKMEVFKSKVEKSNAEIIDFGISDCAETAYALVPKIKKANIDLLFVDMVTYATSSSIAAIYREIRVPIVLVALQPEEALDYKNASTYLQLVNDDICAIPEFTNVAARMGLKVPDIIIGTLYNDKKVDAEILEYCDIAKVINNLKNARIGQMGHVLEAMLDMHTDSTLLTAAFGCHIVQTEPDDIYKYYKNLEESDVLKYKAQIKEYFDFPEPKSDPITEKLTDEDLDTAAKVGVALEQFIKEKKLDGLAYYYEGEPGSEIRKVLTNLIVGNSILTGSGFPMCGEMDLKTCIAMMIMDRLGMGGSFAEFHPIDFKENFVLVGHDGPHHIGIAEGKPVLRSLKKFHGKPGKGASVEFKIKAGPITMLSIVQKADGSFKFVIAEGESVDGPIPPTGNTNTRGFFKPDVITFLKRWFSAAPTHHFALGLGHKAALIEKVGNFLNIETEIVRSE